MRTDAVAMGDGDREVIDYDRATDYAEPALAQVDEALEAQGDAATGNDKDAPQRAKQKRKAAKKVKSDQPTILTQQVFLHFYVAPDLGGFSLEDFFKYIVVGRSGNINEVEGEAIEGARSTGIQPVRWGGIVLLLKDSPALAGVELKQSLLSDGAVVIYYGHSGLARAKPKPKALGLDPRGTQARGDLISKSKLTRLLNKSKAKIFLAGACAASTCIGKVRSDTVVVAIQSSNLTNTVVLANAIIDFVDVLIDTNGTVNEAITAGNARLTKHGIDELVRIHGDGTLRLM
jgi:hypothetical protein